MTCYRVVDNEKKSMYEWIFRVYPNDNFVVVVAPNVERAKARARWQLRDYKYTDLWLDAKREVI